MRRRPIIGLICAVLLAGAGSALSSGAAVRWHAIPKRFTAGLSDNPLLPIGWASGRAWFLSQVFSAQNNSRLVFVSARVSGRGLRSFVKSDLRAYTISDHPILGSSFLVYSRNGPSRIARLGSNGRIGDARPIAGDPEVKAEALFDKEVEARAATATEVGGRTVWVVPGTIPELGHRAVLAVCCTTSGDARDLTSLLSNRRRGGSSYSAGVDGQGRLWLFWVDCVRACARGNIRAVQLDRETLAPRAPTTASREVAVSYVRFWLVCAAECRAVFQTSAVGDMFSWAGTGSPTKIARGVRSAGGIRILRSLLAASSHGSKLSIVYSESAGAPGYPSIVVERGNARGLHLRRVSSTKVPASLGGGVTAWGSPQAFFTPRGVVATQAFGTFRISRYGTAVLR